MVEINMKSLENAGKTSKIGVRVDFISHSQSEFVQIAEKVKK